MPFTATQIIRNAMLKLGYLESVETPEAADVDDCFSAANAWLDALAIKRTFIYYSERVVHPLANGTASYTIGPTGTIARLRPTWIDQWSVILDRSATNPIEKPMGRPLLIEQYQAISMKSLQAQWPYALYFDHAFSTPSAGLASIFLYPVPNQSSSDVVLYIPTPLAQFADKATTQYDFPGGYRRLIEHALAVEFAPILGAVASDDVKTALEEAKLDVEAANFRPSELSIDPFLRIGSVRRWSIETG